ncbi:MULTISPECIES: GNAT family N-acetyltransferase [Streptomyces]|uniref:GNAT family N-acetyltransferase n=1 Tax=Streptomyces TaxID=1883 RepID=UPI00196285DA|nr:MULTISPECIES: GNAT family N-acetyltransferase [Streptomyces]QRX92404.1 GNAT family N-acetyltransferase [Streptomyces noursei]UJB42132.1 GNAT family N-acetyltransferase [Streptomyces sp. A1-5]
MTSTTELRTFHSLEPARQHLMDVYADVRADLLHLPNYAVSSFGERLGRHSEESGWAAVLAYDQGDPVGYAYANTVDSEDRWWKRVTPAPSAEYTDRPAVALKEIGVRIPWRGTGTARRIHDALLSDRDEPYVTLMVNPAAGDGRVHRLYETWGYEDIGRSQPSAASPVLTVMIRTVR